MFLSCVCIYTCEYAIYMQIYRETQFENRMPCITSWLYKPVCESLEHVTHHLLRNLQRLACLWRSQKAGTVAIDYPLCFPLGHS